MIDRLFDPVSGLNQQAALMVGAALFLVPELKALGYSRSFCCC